MQKEGYKGLTSLGREKPCKKNGGKWQKNLIEALTESYRERKFWKLLKSKFEHVKIRFEKTLYKIFDWSKIRFDWTKMLRLNKYQSSIDQNGQRMTKVFNRNFVWLKNRFNQSKFWKKQIFEKKNKLVLCRNPSKHWILRIKCMSMRWNVFQKHKFLTKFSKNLRFLINSLKFSSIKYDLHKTQGIFKLGWSNQRHTQWHVQSLAKSNLCSVCN